MSPTNLTILTLHVTIKPSKTTSTPPDYRARRSLKTKRFYPHTLKTPSGDQFNSGETMQQITSVTESLTEEHPTPCSYHVCKNGHAWPLTITIVGCDGCNSPTYAIEVQNCPVCNEPFHTTQVRIDLSTQIMGFPQTCRGQRGKGLTALVSIPYSSWKDYSVTKYKNPEVDSSDPESVLADSGKERDRVLEERKKTEQENESASNQSEGPISNAKTHILQSSD